MFHSDISYYIIRPFRLSALVQSFTIITRAALELRLARKRLLGVRYDYPRRTERDGLVGSSGKCVEDTRRQFSYQGGSGLHEHPTNREKIVKGPRSNTLHDPI